LEPGRQGEVALRRNIPQSASVPGALVRGLLIGFLLLGTSLLASRGLVLTRLEYALGAVAVVAVFMLVFVRTEVGLYLALLSMLLSPEFVVGGGGALAERREFVLRAEDLLLVVIGLGWLAKTAVNKELGLLPETPLNRPILAYLLVSMLATLVGYMAGTVKTAAGFLYVLKYLEYFIVYFMVVNNLRDRAEAWRFVVVAFLTAVIVSLNGIAQIPASERVSAPFEGEVGEPNTFGGYLLLMIALAIGIAAETRSPRVRLATLGLIGLFLPPFLFTLSRASYFGFIPMLSVFALLGSRRRLILGVLVAAIVLSPLLGAIAPEPVKKRVTRTFIPGPGFRETIRIGPVEFDPSTSQRLTAFKEGIEGWTSRPLLGYGVTGFLFMDAQYPRLLVEVGLFGFFAFGWLVWRLFSEVRAAFRALRLPEDRGLALGLLAGLVGLLFHAVGANTFIIIRIMEPFWFFVAVVLMLPQLEAAAESVSRRATEAGRTSAAVP
jgi:hypothetical protein